MLMLAPDVMGRRITLQDLEMAGVFESIKAMPESVQDSIKQDKLQAVLAGKLPNIPRLLPDYSLRGGGGAAEAASLVVKMAQEVPERPPGTSNQINHVGPAWCGLGSDPLRRIHPVPKLSPTRERGFARANHPLDA